VRDSITLRKQNMDEVVVECAYTINDNKRLSWHIVRVRDDKTRSNNVKIYDEVLKGAGKSITFSDLQEAFSARD
jgi:hypothetical protein